MTSTNFHITTTTYNFNPATVTWTAATGRNTYQRRKHNGLDRLNNKIISRYSKETMSKYPEVKDPSLIGEYPALVKAGGGYVWDDVLEYRVWCHPENGAPDIEEGNDYYYVFESYEAALIYSKENAGAEAPLALVLQQEYIDEPEPGKYVHVKEQRLAEWPVEFLCRPRRTAKTIPNFLFPNAPSNRLEILRGLA